MRTTQQLREAWHPHSQPKGGLHDAYRALDAVLRAWNYPPRAGVTGSYNCRRITGGRGYSLHAYGPDGSFTFWSGVRVAPAIAVDINWDRNPYGRRLVTDMPRGMVDAIKAIRTNSGHQVWGWGGDYRRNKDAMQTDGQSQVPLPACDGSPNSTTSRDADGDVRRPE